MTDTTTQETTDEMISIPKEKLEVYEEFKKSEERKKSLNDLFASEHGETYRKVYDTGGLKERLDQDPTLLDTENRKALGILVETFIEKMTTTTEPVTTPQEKVAQNPNQSPMTQQVNQVVETQTDTFDLKTTSIDELIAKGKIDAITAAEMKAFL